MKNAKRLLFSVGALAIIGVGAATIKFIPGNVPPWRAFHRVANHQGIGGWTASTSSGGVASVGTTYSSPVLTAGTFSNITYGWRGALVVGNDAGDITCVPISMGGTQSWTYTTGGPVKGTPWIGNLIDLDDVYVGSDDGNFYRISNDPAPGTQGTLKGSYSTGGAIRSSPAGDESNGVIYFGSQDDKLYCLQTKTPMQGGGFGFNWSYTTGGNVDSSPAVGNSEVYVGSDDGYLYAVHRFNGLGYSAGDLFFRYQTGGAIKSSPCLDGSADVVFGSQDDYIYSVDSVGGTLNWRYQTGGNVDSSPTLSTSGTNIYVGSDDGYLYCISTAGTFQWRLNLGSPIKSSPAVMADGTILVGTDGDGVYHVSTTGSSLNHYSASVGVRSSPAIGLTDPRTGAVGRAFYVTTAGSIIDLK
jgi:outer membrane protein assembly factor BamB